MIELTAGGLDSLPSGKIYHRGTCKRPKANDTTRVVDQVSRSLENFFRVRRSLASEPFHQITVEEAKMCIGKPQRKMSSLLKIWVDKFQADSVHSSKHVAGLIWRYPLTELSPHNTIPLICS